MKYERKIDLEHELEIKAAVEKTGKVKLIKSGKFTRLDFVMTEIDGNCIGLCECKARNHAKAQHYTFIIDYNKVESACYLTRFFKNEKTGKPVDFFIFVKFIDGIMFYKWNGQDAFTIKPGGRKDRGDKDDIQAVVHIPLHKFKELK